MTAETLTVPGLALMPLDDVRSTLRALGRCGAVPDPLLDYWLKREAAEQRERLGRIIDWLGEHQPHSALAMQHRGPEVGL